MSCEYCNKRTPMTPNEYQRLAARTMRADLSAKETEKHALFGMAAELGELHGIYQKTYQCHEFDADHVKKELGDMLWFIAEFCTSWRWNLEDIMQMNIEKLRARYPDGFEGERSLHRAEGDI